jgi:cytidine deaminase
MDIAEEKWEELRAAARAASRHAYCPYSRFPVGAAVLSEAGEVFAGCNVENAAYGESVCAERNAIFRMVAQGGRRLRAVVVYTPTPAPAAPCGSCRLVASEFGPDAEVLSFCDGPGVLRRKLSEWLPEAFGPGNLR